MKTTETVNYSIGSHHYLAKTLGRARALAGKTGAKEEFPFEESYVNGNFTDQIIEGVLKETGISLNAEEVQERGIRSNVMSDGEKSRRLYNHGLEIVLIDRRETKNKIIPAIHLPRSTRRGCPHNPLIGMRRESPTTTVPDKTYITVNGAINYGGSEDPRPIVEASVKVLNSVYQPLCKK